MASPLSPADADLSHEQPGQQQQQQQPAPDSPERELVDLLFHREPLQQFSIPQPPKHWNNTRRTAAGILELVQLPLPRDPPATRDSFDVKESAVLELMEQGLSRDDAVAALIKARGDVMAALVNFAAAASLECAGQDAAGEEAAAADGAPDPSLAEVLSVLTAFHKTSKHLRVMRIERVQNLPLWLNYLERVQQLEEEAGPSGVQKLLLFHGSDMGCLSAIIRHGFDIKCSNHGSLGKGIYFSSASSTSDGYSRGFTARSQVARSSASAALEAERQAPEGDRPCWQDGGRAMLLCQVHQMAVVVLGGGDKSGCHATLSTSKDILAVYSNAQAYPSYIIHYVDGRAPYLPLLAPA